MRPAKRRLSGPARTFMTSLRHSKAAVWTVDDVARSTEMNMAGAWSRNKRAARDLACRVTDRPSLSRSRGEWRARAGGEMLPSSIIAECLSSRAASAAAPAASLHHSLISIMSSVYSAGPSSASRQTSADCSRLDVLPCRSCRTLPTSCFTPTAPKKRRGLPTTTTVFV